MNFTKVGKNNFRTQPQYATVTRVIPFWRFCDGFDFIHLKTQPRKHGQGIGLSIKQIHGSGRLCPIFWPRHTGPDASGNDVLVLGLSPGKSWADLKQPGDGDTPVGVTPGGGNKIGQQ